MKYVLLSILAVAMTACSASPEEEGSNPPSSDEGGFKADRFELTAALCTENPSPEALNVYAFLRENFGKKVISGAMSEVSWNMNEVEWLHTATGLYPALWCVDYIHLEWGEPDWTGYADLQTAQEWWDANGLMAASWHWNVPKREGDTDPSQMAFYTADTDFDVSQATVAGTYENEVIEEDLGKIVVHLLGVDQPGERYGMVSGRRICRHHRVRFLSFGRCPCIALGGLLYPGEPYRGPQTAGALRVRRCADAFGDVRVGRHVVVVHALVR